MRMRLKTMIWSSLIHKIMKMKQWMRTTKMMSKSNKKPLLRIVSTTFSFLFFCKIVMNFVFVEDLSEFQGPKPHVPSNRRTNQVWILGAIGLTSFYFFINIMAYVIGAKRNKKVSAQPINPDEIEMSETVSASNTVTKLNSNRERLLMEDSLGRLDNQNNGSRMALLVGEKLRSSTTQPMAINEVEFRQNTNRPNSHIRDSMNDKSMEGVLEQANAPRIPSANNEMIPSALVSIDAGSTIMADGAEIPQHQGLLPSIDRKKIVVSGKIEEMPGLHDDSDSAR